MSLDRVPERAPVTGAVASDREMCVFSTILGSAADAEFHEEIHRLEHDHAVDHLRLAKTDLSRRRLRAVTEAGREIAIALPRHEHLFDGAVLEFGAGSALVVRVEAERWLRLRPTDAPRALKLGYFCGNLHWRVQFDGEDILVAVETEEKTYLDRLGPTLEAGEALLIAEPHAAHPHPQPAGHPKA
ncbi:urease accessory protein UreE [Salipiger pentaromativorans]|uniref:urease accessory protein UreE n=1 Tax=Salipiger pentaromativorans TaxID=2943193 RepID=UPI00308447E5